MKLLLFSDNHRDRLSVKQAIEKHPKMDRYISLGDSEMREHELTNLGVVGVKGNYPFEPKFPYQLSFEFLGLKLFFTHGHLFSVKLGLSKLLNHALYNDINIVCYGHTHKASIREIRDVIFINPGSLSRNRFGTRNSYCILEITDSIINIEILSLSGKTIMEYRKER